MDKLFSTLLIVIFIMPFFTLYAQGSDEFLLEDVVVASYERQLPPITLVKLADFVALNCTITNDTRDEDKRRGEVYETLRTMAVEAEKTKAIEIKSGVHIITKDEYKIDLSAGNRPDVSTLDIILKIPLKENDSLLSLKSRLNEFAVKAKMIGRTELDMGDFGISVVKPEKYRYELISKIFADIKKIKESFKSDLNIFISGLDSRLQIRRYSSKEIELYLNYSFQLHSGDNSNGIEDY